LKQVRAWRTILATAIATLWVAAGSHCLLETLPGLEFLSCCQHPEAEKTPSHHEKECDGDGCAAVELGFYKLEQPQPAPVRQFFGLVVWLVPLPDNCRPSALDFLVSVSSSPPELPRLWQFAQRTALPPRAPSFVS
jgi:hypothetical protein